MRNNVNRCQEQIFNIKKNRYYRCNNFFYIDYNDKKICWCHYNKIVKKSIILIQKIYRSYRVRRFINIYKKLPQDIQFLINTKMNTEYYYKLHCNSIYKILHNRYINLNNFFYFNNAIYTNPLNNITNDDFISLFNLHIYPTYYLYNKYFDIILNTNNKKMLEDVKSMHIFSFPIINKIRITCQNYFYENILNNSNKELYNKMINSIFIINMLSEKYETLDYL